jgi:hypothetical protein
MNITIPELNQFALEELGRTPSVFKTSPNAEVSFKVNIESCLRSRRVVVGILDESRRCGIAVAIYPATGEVCDLNNGGGVIGYLARASLVPGVPISCELTLHRFGGNVVSSVRIRGEVFLYPAFSMTPSTTPLSAFVGQENVPDAEGVGWSDLQLEVMGLPVAA